MLVSSLHPSSQPHPHSQLFPVSPLGCAAVGARGVTPELHRLPQGPCCGSCSLHSSSSRAEDEDVPAFLQPPCSRAWSRDLRKQQHETNYPPVMCSLDFVRHTENFPGPLSQQRQSCFHVRRAVSWSPQGKQGEVASKRNSQRSNLYSHCTLTQSNRFMGPALTQPTPLGSMRDLCHSPGNTKITSPPGAAPLR